MSIRLANVDCFDDGILRQDLVVAEVGDCEAASSPLLPTPQSWQFVYGTKTLVAVIEGNLKRIPIEKLEFSRDVDRRYGSTLASRWMGKVVIDVSVCREAGLLVHCNIDRKVILINCLRLAAELIGIEQNYDSTLATLRFSVHNLEIYRISGVEAVHFTAGLPSIVSISEKTEKIGSKFSNTDCKYWSDDRYLRCAVNPIDGCENCKDYECSSQ